MTLRWRYGIHRSDVGRGSLEASGSVATVDEIVQIAKSNPERKIAVYAPLDETQDERDILFKSANVERLFP